MKTLRFLGMALIAILVSVSFSACSSSDDDDNGGGETPASIVGTWIESGKAKSYQGKLVFSGQETSGNVTYLEDNKTIWTGTYKVVNGSKLTITKSDTVYFECTIKTLTSSTLILERIESDGDIETTTYKRQ